VSASCACHFFGADDDTSVFVRVLCACGCGCGCGCGCVGRRGRGLGKQLVGEAERVVKEWGFAEMLLLVEKTNTPAIGLYK
jgi:GNAT superfamily N-acetyltransferase